MPSLLGHPYPESYTPRGNHRGLLPRREEALASRGEEALTTRGEEALATRGEALPLPSYLVAERDPGGNSGVSYPIMSSSDPAPLLFAEDPAVCRP